MQCDLRTLVFHIERYRFNWITHVLLHKSSIVSQSHFITMKKRTAQISCCYNHVCLCSFQVLNHKKAYRCLAICTVLVWIIRNGIRYHVIEGNNIVITRSETVHDWPEFYFMWLWELFVHPEMYQQLNNGCDRYWCHPVIKTENIDVANSSGDIQTLFL